MNNEPANRPCACGQSAITNGSWCKLRFVSSAGLEFVRACGVVAIAADKSAAIKAMMNLYHPTGPLSGVTTAAIVAWLVVWIVLALRWRTRDVAIKPVGAVALVLLVLGVLLTFPPIADLF